MVKREDRARLGMNRRKKSEKNIRTRIKDVCCGELIS